MIDVAFNTSEVKFSVVFLGIFLLHQINLLCMKIANYEIIVSF